MNDRKKISNLVNAVKKGDQIAFKTIHDLHYTKLAAYINGFTKNDYETEDILQETFIKLWNSREKLDAVNSINAYLYKTAYYTYVDKYRKDKREQSVLDSWKYKRLMATLDDDDEINTNRIEKLKLEIEKLPTKCKKVFLLCKYENLSYAQIAERLEISPKTVQAQMCRAYKLIRERLKDQGVLNLFLYFKRLKVQKVFAKSS
ncbi:RNA polymerase sigma factor [Flavivirga spongiicola]|uniref:Sigma-70 family RNA polymerase sigma factor n=1 Tax=Flavivirga spongiicola TaxID=421621 RepID=A0ABU7XPZ9_9FLAO|nr:sigma-70 family RNA polymerase sigma factor [Flavivirga sp. MEBiC05379]MDO5977854.1 sigma-70 family RNA polymerase sigma factor [Flavivirga sp. MEBiC05379]